MASLGCVVALLALLVGCDIGGDTCAGSQHGDVTLYASQQGEDPSRALPGGGSAFVHRVDFDTGPATVSIGIRGDTKAAAREVDLAVGDSFEVAGTSYTVVGFCETKAYLRQSDANG